MVRRVSAREAQANYILSTMKPQKPQPNCQVKVIMLTGEEKWIKLYVPSGEVKEAADMASLKKGVDTVEGVHFYGCGPTVWL
jgi:hypothetical protein